VLNPRRRGIMRTLFISLTIATLLAFIGQPAAAQNYQTTIQINYWGAPLSFGNPSPTVASDTASAWGARLRLDSKTSPWSFSGGFNALSITPVNWPWNSGTVWDVNAHYRFGANANLNSYLGLIAGFGGVSVNSPVVGQNGSSSGFRVGAEFMVRQPAGWYFTGEGTYGPSWSTNFSGFPGAASSNVIDLRAAVGYEFSGGWGLEAGWRWYDWKTGTGPGCLAPGCETTFSGVTAAITFRK
jgi:hypothetical protein